MYISSQNHGIRNSFLVFSLRSKMNTKKKNLLQKKQKIYRSRFLFPNFVFAIDFYCKKPVYCLDEKSFFVEIEIKRSISISYCQDEFWPKHQEVLKIIFSTVSCVLSDPKSNELLYYRIIFFASIVVASNEILLNASKHLQLSSPKRFGF